MTTPRPAPMIVLVRELASMPRRFMAVNRIAKNTAKTAKGISGIKFIAALLHQITEMIGFIT